MQHIPLSTYRIQFNHTYGFNAAFDIVGYLVNLGISDLYASPILKSRKGSMHGYDAVDPDQLNPELGTPEDYENLIAEVKRYKLGWLQDIVPNHMAYSFENKLLIDLLENGSNSRYYDFFDIEWNHPHASARQRLLAPFLGNYYQKVIDSGEIQLRYDTEGFSINYYDTRLPVKLESYTDILSYRLGKLRNKLGSNHPDIVKFMGVLYAFKSLFSIEDMDERYDQIKFAKGMLWELYSSDQEIKMFVDENLKIYNGEKDQPESFNLLDQLLSQQYFRLAYWKVANEEINYRRFFNISDLISLKMENETAFGRMHSYIFRLLKEEKISGLRIDHIDGLYDPTSYLVRLRKKAPKAYIVVEKILELEEDIDKRWPVEGTTGYEFINYLNGIFVDTDNEREFTDIYRGFAQLRDRYDDIVADSKRLIIEARMAGEVERLAFLVESISSKDRYGIDITMHGLKRALEEILTYFPVYRTYINAEGFSQQDIRYIEDTLRKVKRRKPRLTNEFDYIGSLLLQKYSDSFTEEQKLKTLDFVMKFQQLTGPLMAKGFEDTSLYIYNRLVSLNEVGGNPLRFGISLDEFHNYNRIRQQEFPNTLNSASTHDTKRGEDTRARINVLSELPGEWRSKLEKWSAMNSKLKSDMNGIEVPAKNDEYFLYQNMLGSYPLHEEDRADYVQRLKDYLVKACREGKTYSSWVSPDPDYENAYQLFAEQLLKDTDDNQFIKDFIPFASKVAHYGVFNSLSQTLVRITSPGVPDFYQGSELWNFSLVDPDNRRPVDYDKRKQYLKEINKFETDAVYIKEIVENWQDGRVKMFLIYKALKFRNGNEELMKTGEYIPLPVSGSHASSVLAYARKMEDKHAVVVVPRLLTRVVDENSYPMDMDVWGDTSVVMPVGTFYWKNAITGDEIRNEKLLPVGVILSSYPAAILYS